MLKKRVISNRQYSYSQTALGRKTSQHDCEANAGNFLAKTKIRKSRLKCCKPIEIRKKKQDLKAVTLVQRNCGRAGRANSKIEKATEPLEETNSLV